MDDSWPAPVGHASAALVLPSRGVTKEERLRHQLQSLHEEYEAAVDEKKQAVHACRELEAAIEAAQKDAADTSRCADQLREEIEGLKAQLEKADRAARVKHEEHREKESFYKEYIARLDEAGGFGFGGAGAAEDGRQPPPALDDVRTEFLRKEYEMALRFLAKEIASLKGDSHGPARGDADDAAEELHARIERLSEEVEEMEGHVVRQQTLRREVQHNLHKQAAEFEEQKDASEAEHRRQVSQLESQLKQARAAEESLSGELSLAQRRGLAAQRQLDELRSQAAAADDASNGTPSNSSFSLQLSSLETSLQKLETENVALRLRVRDAQGDLAEAKRSEVEAKTMHASLAASARENSAARADLAALRIKYETVALQHATTRSLLEHKASQLATLHAELAKFKEQDASSTALRLELAAASAGSAATTGEISSLRSKLAAAEGVERSLKAEVGELEAKLRREYDSSVAVSAQLDIYKRKAAAAEEDAARLREERRALEASLAEKQAAADRLAGEAAAAASESERARAELAEAAHGYESRAVKLKGDADKDVDWLQTEVAKARKAAGKADRRARDAEARAAAAEKSAEKSARAQKLLLKELRNGDFGSALLPLSDHKSLPVGAAIDLIAGGMDSWNKILLSLDALDEATENTQAECAFLLALSRKLELMLAHVKTSTSYANISATYQALIAKSRRVLKKFDIDLDI
ncbi:hypothetical protein DIPPA_28616 [Diplonema papillatum]|nr:hypothetical protein DIPPA_28616 [Diplonema papillatum]